MFFNSFEFAIFLPVVFLLYWFVFNKNLKIQNAFILLVSYIFYGWWDWRFLSLIVISSICDYLIAISLEKTEAPKKRKLLLFASLGINLGFLGFFKYCNFFIESFVDVFTFFGRSLSVQTLRIVLPVGISFYTFQTLSYTIDIYRKHLKPTHDIIAFFAYVSFFPQLVAGPIERATNLLPQFAKPRKFDYSKAVEGCRQILYGLFKKIVIADNCARFANEIFDNYQDYNGSTLFLGAIYFAFQIYGDFSGYSDIAIGSAKLFNFDLMVNFKTPYFSRDIAEFWRRWHISLNTWFRDYLYIPLGGSRGGVLMKFKNTLIIFLVSGFWHGANWTFIAWGTANALLFLPLMLSNNNRKNLDTVASGKLLPNVKEIFQMGTTFSFTCLAWVFFRAENISSAFSYLGGIFSMSLFQAPQWTRMLPLCIGFVFIEWFFREDGIENTVPSLKLVPRRLVYFALFLGIIYFGNFFEVQEFIYFQF